MTICTKDRELLFGDIINGEMVLNDLGNIVESVWESLPDHHPVELDQFQIMPNHIHMIIMIVGATRGSPENNIKEGRSRPAPTLGTIIGLFKSECSKKIRIMTNNQKFHVCQRNYYEHIIRNDAELEKISWYIINNPGLWNRDRNNPNFISSF